MMPTDAEIEAATDVLYPLTEWERTFARRAAKSALKAAEQERTKSGTPVTVSPPDGMEYSTLSGSYVFKLNRT